MRLIKRGAPIVSGRRSSGAAKTGTHDAELGLIHATAKQQNRPASGFTDAAAPTPKVIRRQDYAPAYQMLNKTPGPSAPAVAVAKPAQTGRRLKIQPRFVIAAGALALAAAVLAGLALLRPQVAIASGEEVLYGGRMLCIAESREAAEQAMLQLESDFESAYGMDIQTDEALTFAPVACDKQNILSGDGVKEALKNNVAVHVLASVITVNERPAVALHTDAEAQQALDAVLQPYRNAPTDRNRTDIAFVETVKIEQMPIDYTLVQGVDAAAHALASGADVADNLYTVEKGDSLAKIARKFSMKVSDILKANPDLSSEGVIQPGQSLNVIQPNNWVNVRYSETVTRQEDLPYETVEQSDASLYTTQKKVTQEGEKGQREVVAKITYINGMEAREDILSQTVKVPAQNEIVLRGTKKVPTNSGGNASVSGKFMAPLKGYTITSVFGTRTLQGVTRTHYGIDMAAPKGTPIYASASGTIIYSGSASGYGLVVYIDHGNGVVTRYGHCSKLLVKKGQKVNRGQIIALVGSTGHSTGPHCHFEMRINGKAVDPRKHVKL